MSRVTRPGRTSPARGQGAFRLLLLVLAAVLALAGARVFGLSLPPQKKTPFDPSRLLKIRAQKPHYVLIGNSYLGSRVDRRLLRKLIAPRRASLISRGGTHPAHWYLHFKNDVIASGVSPKRVIFFFRGTTLTLPSRRGLVRSWEYDEYSHEYEPVLRRLLSAKPTTPGEDLKLWAAHMVPISRFRTQATRRIKSIGLHVSNLVEPLPRARGTATPGSIRTAEINSLFNVDKLRESAERDGPLTASGEMSADFDVSVERSVLPEIIRLARSNGIDVFFFRVKERGQIGVPEENPEARIYYSKLEAYLEDAQVGYRNMRFETWVPRDWFRDNVHVKRNKRADYTRAFVTNVPEVFE